MPVSSQYDTMRWDRPGVLENRQDRSQEFTVCRDYGNQRGGMLVFTVDTVFRKP